MNHPEASSIKVLADDLCTISELLTDLLIRLEDPKTIADVRQMSPQYQEPALSHMLQSLDTTLLFEDGPGYFCADWYVEELSNPEIVRMILESDCTTPQTIVDWLDAREQAEQKAKEGT